MMKKIKGLVLTLLLLLPLFSAFGLATQANAQSEEVELIIHKRILRDVYREDFNKFQNNGMEADEKLDVISKATSLNGANFAVYDITNYYETKKQGPEAFMEEISKLTRTEIRELIADENLQEVPGSPIKTQTDNDHGKGIARISVPRQNDGRFAVYLLFETGIDDTVEFNIDIEKMSVPLVVILPIMNPDAPAEELEHIHIYPKNIGYLRDPYFFKYGKQDSEAEGIGDPLQGVEFALYRETEDGRKLYLDLSEASDLQNTWVESTDPINDERISKFTSDADGLVTMGGRLLASGTYYFEELKSVEGYEISEENKRIEVIVPDSWEDENGNPLYVTVNGQRMLETLDGTVPDGAYETLEPRVYNYRTPEDPPITPETPETPSEVPPKKPLLPVTGEAKSFISLIGLLLVGIVTVIWYRRKKTTNE